jgi:[ribosomal protein S5]-alanine N-acetyltransferase
MNDTDLFNFSSFPTLTTERLFLREPLPTDAADVLIFRSDPEVQRYNGAIFQSVGEVQGLIEEVRAEYAAQEGITWAVTLNSSDTVLGLFGFHDWNKYHRRAEIGYDLARAYWGQGIGSEAVRAIVRFGFEQMNLNRIYVGTIADNHESVRLLERIGFQREGTRRKHSWEEDGTFHDSAMYGLLRGEYRKALHRRDS